VCWDLVPRICCPFSGHLGDPDGDLLHRVLESVARDSDQHKANVTTAGSIKVQDSSFGVVRNQLDERQLDSIPDLVCLHQLQQKYAIFLSEELIASWARNGCDVSSWFVLLAGMVASPPPTLCLTRRFRKAWREKGAR